MQFSSFVYLMERHCRQWLVSLKPGPNDRFFSVSSLAAVKGMKRRSASAGTRSITISVPARLITLSAKRYWNFPEGLSYFAVDIIYDGDFKGMQ